MEISLHSRKSHLLPCLFVTIIFLFLIIPARATSITFDYEQFLDLDRQNLNIDGDVFQENGMLNLTRYKNDSAGRVTYKNLLQLWDKETRTLANFTTRFTFIINDLNKTNGIGDGITFFMAHPNFPLPVPPDGSGIGLVGRREMKDPNYPNEHPFVAVEFDTFPNRDLGDPPYDHVGIDVKEMWTPYITQWYTMNDGRKYDAEITYNSSSQQLTVRFTGFKDNVSIQQNYSKPIDLREYLPEQVQFGFSSSTGLLFELHTLCSWSFNSSAATLGIVVNKQGKSNKGLIIGLSIGSVVVIVGSCIACFLIWKFNCRAEEEGRLDVSLDRDFESVGPKRFSYNELVRATNNFLEENKLGEGGFGGVYKGFMRDLNSYVAIKKVSQESKQGVREYASEVKIISQLRHKNLVQLMGWCHEKNDLLLIYEFMPNGSLDYHLFQSKNLLAWPTRYNIAQGLASAILYLHEEWEQCVVHRDIKSSNIMLDSNFNTKLGDFGLARLVEHGKGLTTTIAAGTKGYMAPECLAMGKATRESDMYSFGIVALEIACGRKPIDPNASDEQVLMVQWVWELYGRGELHEAFDKRLDNNGDFDEQELERLMILGLWCAHPDYTMRPTIRQALNVLNSEAPLPNLPPTMPKPIYRKDSAGRVTYSKLLQLWDKETGKIADFTTRFTFIIDSPDKNHRGDGITFFLAHPNFSLPVPPDGSGIGLVGRKQVMDDPNYTLEHPFVAVEFDTFPNDDDPPYDHVGVDINKMWTPYTTEWFSIKDGRKYDAEITYNSSSYQLNVFFTGYKDDKTIQQDYSHGINLREVLPDQVQFGFSSATGLLWEIHTLCSWSFDSSLLGEN